MIRDQVIERSGGQCEAMVRVNQVWTRCGISPVEDHHALTRARGGAVLDEVGEIYHHVALCRKHHRDVDEFGFDSGLMIQGWVYKINGVVAYSGPDQYLKNKYGSNE